MNDLSSCKIRWPLNGLFLVLTLLPGASIAETDEQRTARLAASIRWQDGPCTAALGDIAEIDVPSGFHFTDAEGARAWNALTSNPPDDRCLGVLVPSSMTWFVTFEFDAVGYVKDDEKDQLDPDALLQGIRAATEKSNEFRRQQGWGELHVVGWEETPSYTDDTHQLVWAIRGDGQAGPVINYQTRVLGRGGVMSVNLVDSPESFRSVVPLVKGMLSGFRFQPGHRYGEWRPGDKVAAYGLTALIVGGGTSIAAKTGLLAKIWKPVLAFIACFIAWLKGSRLLGALQKKPT